MDVRKSDTLCYLLPYVRAVQFYGENILVLQVVHIFQEESF